MKIREFFKSYGPEIGIVGGIAGMWVAAGFSIYATVKVVRKLDKAKEEKGEELTLKEKAKIVIPWFTAPTLIAIGSTISVAMGTKGELARSAAFASVAALAERALNAQEKATEEVVGEEKAKEIKKEAAKQLMPPEEIVTEVDNIIDTGEGDSLFCDPYLLPGVVFTGNWQKIRSNVNDICAAMNRSAINNSQEPADEYVRHAYGIDTPEEAYGCDYFGALQLIGWDIYSDAKMPDIGDYPTPRVDRDGRTVLYITHNCKPRAFR